MDVTALQMPFSVGDRVRIAQGTRYSVLNSPANPQDVTGTIISIRYYKYIRVKWVSDDNWYEKHDLVLAREGILWAI